jgi:hypothetical protein
VESGKVLAARCIGLEAARRSRRSIAPRRVAAQEAPRNMMAQEAARSIAPEAESNTHIGQRESDRSGDRQRNRIRRRGQQKAAGP